MEIKFTFRELSRINEFMTGLLTDKGLKLVENGTTAADQMNEEDLNWMVIHTAEFIQVSATDLLTRTPAPPVLHAPPELVAAFRTHQPHIGMHIISEVWKEGKDHVKDNSKIRFIKEVRTQTGLSLVEAKQITDECFHKLPLS